MESTDLTTIYDHPAVLLAKIPEGDESWGSVEHRLGSPDLILRRHEAEHSVTFVALSNDALAAVREEYARCAALNHTSTLMHLVNDLLGLDNQ
jgi:hypothetical protein